MSGDQVGPSSGSRARDCLLCLVLAISNGETDEKEAFEVVMVATLSSKEGDTGISAFCG